MKARWHVAWTSFTRLEFVLVVLMAATFGVVPGAAQGDGPAASPPTTSATVVGIAGGSNSNCARALGGAVKCWGFNASGQLGQGDTATRGDAPGELGDALLPVDLGTGRSAVEVGAGSGFACARLDNGSIKCWGFGARTGLGSTTNRGDNPGEMGDMLPVLDLGSGRTAARMVAGPGHTCAILDNGALKCWGSNNYGQLGIESFDTRGDGPTEMGDNLPPVNLGTGRTVLDVSVGDARTCALLNGGDVKCWGFNQSGQLGLGDIQTRGNIAGTMGDNLPALLLGTAHHAIAVSVGSHGGCVILEDHAVKCWGQSSVGENGLGDEVTRGDEPNEMGDNLPIVDLGTGRTATAISVGARHTCAILDNGMLKCWGDNASGQLGLGDTENRGDEPGEMGDALPSVNLGTGRNAASVVAGNGYTCAVLDNGTVKCWGSNAFGNLGQGDLTSRGDGANEMGDALLPVDLGTATSCDPWDTAEAALKAMHIIVGLDVDVANCTADVNNSGTVDILDVLVIRQAAAGLVN